MADVGVFPQLTSVSLTSSSCQQMCICKERQREKGAGFFSVESFPNVAHSLVFFQIFLSSFKNMFFICFNNILLLDNCLL